MLNLDEGEIKRIGVDHVVLHALAPRVRDMALECRRPRAASGLLQQGVAIGERYDDIIGLMGVPPGFGAGNEPPLGHAYMRLRDVNMGHGFRAWGHGQGLRVRLVLRLAAANLAAGDSEQAYASIPASDMYCSLRS